MVNFRLYAWVVRGKQRLAVLKALSHPMTPSQVHKKSKQFNEKISLNNASDALRSLVKQNLAICLNSDARIGRVYQLTEAGEEIRKELMKE